MIIKPTRTVCGGAVGKTIGGIAGSALLPRAGVLNRSLGNRRYRVGIIAVTLLVLLPLSDWKTRLEFRPFGAVKRHRPDLLLPCYPAARRYASPSRLPQFHLPASPINFNSAPFPHSRAPAATTGARFLTTCDTPVARGSQQRVAGKVILRPLGHQQLFTNTPSELISPFPHSEEKSHASPERRVAGAAIVCTSAREVQQ